MVKIKLIFVTCDFTWHVWYQRASIVKSLSKKHCIESGSAALLSPRMATTTDELLLRITMNYELLLRMDTTTSLPQNLQIEEKETDEQVRILLLFFSLSVIYSYEIGFSYLCNSLFKMFLYRYALVLIRYVNLVVKYS